VAFHLPQINRPSQHEALADSAKPDPRAAASRHAVVLGGVRAMPASHARCVCAVHHPVRLSTRFQEGSGGGIAAWEGAGFRIYSGVHVPSKAFAERQGALHEPDKHRGTIRNCLVIRARPQHLRWRV
jgi:hypothetical protein